MKKYLSKVQELQKLFHSFSITQIPRSRNKRADALRNNRADALSKLASSSFAHLTKNVLLEIVECRSIDDKIANSVGENEGTWMDPIIQYLTTRSLPDDQTEVRKIRIKAPQYTIKENILYRKGYLTPWLRCVGPEEAEYVLKEVHFGSCGAHTGARSIAQKAARLGYYWPSMYSDASKLVGKCRACQQHAPTI